MKRTTSLPQNPIAEEIRQMVEPTVKIIRKACWKFLQLQTVGGHTHSRRGYRAATNREVAILKTFIAADDWDDLRIDLRKPIPAQFVAWLRLRIADLEAAAQRIERIKDKTDYQSINRLVKGSAN